MIECNSAFNEQTKGHKPEERLLVSGHQDSQMETREGGRVGQTSADGAEDTLWSRILASTDRRSARGPGSNDRAGSSRRIIVLGGHDSGKSTVIRALARSDSSDNTRHDSRRNKGKAVAGPEQDKPDIGINFQYIDLADDGDSREDASSRLSVYQVPPTSNDLHASLLPMALSRESLLDSLVLIILDWEKPWTFLRELRRWLEAVRKVMNDIENDKAEASAAQESRRRKGKYVVDECRELLETYVRSYQEPSAKDGTQGTASTSFPSATAAASDDRAPLPEGSLAFNPGCNIVVVCNKSDAIQALERDAQLNEETIEYIQQMLRTICLQYGAAIFFTSHYHPSTLLRLRSYVLHRLHALSTLQHVHMAAESDTSQPTNAAAAAVATSSRYPFPYRANAVDREQICIPTGWDSFGKIRVLREGFDCAALARGWSLDMGQDIDTHEEGAVSTLALYESIVTDIDTLRNPNAAANAYLEVQNEQDFLKAHYDMLAREAAKHRQQLQQQQLQQQQATASTSGKASNPAPSPDITDVAKKFFGSAGIVGPMASAGLSLPTVEKALDRESASSPVDSSSNNRRAGLERRESTRPSSSLTNGHVLSPTLPHATSPPLPVSPTPSTGGSQNEVLANFFQSLLNDRKDKAGKGSAGPAGGGNASSNRNSADLSKSASRR